MAIITPKLDNNHVFEERIFTEYSFEFFFTNALAADDFAGLVDEFEAPVVAHLEATNYANWTKPLAKINFLIYFIANVILTPFNK